MNRDEWNHLLKTGSATPNRVTHIYPLLHILVPPIEPPHMTDGAAVIKAVRGHNR